MAATVIEAWKINQKFVILRFNMKMAGKLYKRLLEGKSVVDSREPVVDSGEWVVGKKPVVESGKLLVVSGLSSVVCRLVLLSAIGFWLTAFSWHPYYMSVTEFTYNPPEKEVQVSCKIFTDDLEGALKQSLKRKVDILNASAKKENEQLLNTYVQAHLKLQLDGKAVPMQMIGFEQEGEAVWVYFVTKNTVPFKTATVFNDILYNYKEEQINIIHFKNAKDRKSHRLNYPEKQVTFNW